MTSIWQTDVPEVLKDLALPRPRVVLRWGQDGCSPEPCTDRGCVVDTCTCVVMEIFRAKEEEGKWGHGAGSAAGRLGSRSPELSPPQIAAMTSPLRGVKLG